MRCKNKNNELEHLNEVYDFDNPHLLCFGLTKDKAKKVLQTMETFADRRNFSAEVAGPDMVAKYNSTIIGIEHFGYDASSKNRKGSAERREIGIFDRQFCTSAKRAARRGEGMVRTYEMTSVSSQNTFISNFLSGFHNHRERLGAYMQNIKNAYQDNNYECWFLAEDCSSLSPFFFSQSIIDGGHEHTLLPIMYSKVRAELAESDVDGFIFVSNFPLRNQFVFVENSSVSLKAVLDYYCFSDDTPVQFSNHSIMSFSSILLSKIAKIE